MTASLDVEVAEQRQQACGTSRHGREQSYPSVALASGRLLAQQCLHRHLCMHLCLRMCCWEAVGEKLPLQSRCLHFLDEQQSSQVACSGCPVENARIVGDGPLLETVWIAATHRETHAHDFVEVRLPHRVRDVADPSAVVAVVALVRFAGQMHHSLYAEQPAVLPLLRRRH
jgi:hypothetical protein